MTSTAEQIRTAEARPLPKARWRRVLPVCLWLLGLALLTGAGLESYRVLIGRNLHTVLPGRVYRSAQPSLASLQALVKKHGIRTVLNLRGGSPPLPWYQREAAATCELDLCQEDVNLSAGRLPSSTELRRLVEVLDRTEYPMLIHCRRGSDRTGLVATLILLLQEGSNFEQACGQLSMRYGHVSLGRTEHVLFTPPHL